MSPLVTLIIATSFVTVVTIAFTRDPTDVYFQCVNRGYAGACKVNQNFHGFFKKLCESLICGKVRGPLFFAYNTGHANDGTFCGPNLACKGGKCTERTSISRPSGRGATLKCIGQIYGPL